MWMSNTTALLEGFQVKMIDHLARVLCYRLSSRCARDFFLFIISARQAILRSRDAS
jgi:hypothetical protein